MEIIVWIQYIAIIAVIVAAVVIGIVKVFRWSENNHSETTEHKATLIKKGTQVSNNPRRPRGVIVKYENTAVYSCTFRLENGKKLRLNLPLNEVVKIKEGDGVMLKLQGTRFVSLNKISDGETIS